MRRNSVVKQVLDSNVLKSALSVGFGIAVVLLCLLGFSFLLTFVDGSDEVKSAMASLSLCAGAFASGFFCGKNKREKGIVNGVFCGLCVYFAVFATGTLLLNITADISAFGKALLCCALSALGGIIGVNSKQNFKALRPKKNRFGS